MISGSVLARNEEFSKIAVINFFFSSQKKNTVIEPLFFRGSGISASDADLTII